MGKRWAPFLIILSCLASLAPGKAPILVSFDDAQEGGLPKGWVAGVTGKGTPKWAVMKDETAPSKPNVLAQKGKGTFPFCIDSTASIEDGFVEVKFKPISGKEDQAGGIIWRFKDKENYYTARANALEDNVTIYHTVKGSRREFKSTRVTVASKVWHSLRVDFSGDRFVVTFDDQKVLDASDRMIQGAGAVGVWTKADSVTYFDEFQCGPPGS